MSAFVEEPASLPHADTRHSFVETFYAPAELAWIRSPGSMPGAAFGAAWIITYGWVDPGNLMAAVNSSRQLPLLLNLLVLLLSGLLCLYTQGLAVRLGVHLRKDLASAVRDTYGRPLALALWLVGEVSVVAADLQGLLIGGSVLQWMLGVPLAGGVAILALDTFTFAVLAHFSRTGAHMLGAITLAMLAGSLALLCVRPSSPVPHSHPTDTVAFASTAGALLMPYNVVLHSAMSAQVSKAAQQVDFPIDRLVRLLVWGTMTALAVALSINFVLVLAFRAAGDPRVTTFSLHAAIKALDLPAAQALFAGVTLVSALLGPIVYTLAGQIMCQGFIDLRSPSWKRAIIIRLLIIGPAMAVAIVASQSEKEARLSAFVDWIQVFSFPLFLAPLLRLAPSSYLEKTFGGLVMLMFIVLAATDATNELSLVTSRVGAASLVAVVTIVYLVGVGLLLFGSRGPRTVLRSAAQSFSLGVSPRPGLISGLEVSLPEDEDTLQQSTPTTLFTVVLAMLAMIGGILFGYDLGVVSGALPLISEDWGLSPLEEEVVVSTLLVGALFGSPLGGLLCDKIGRRFALLFAATLLWQGIIICAYAPNLYVLLAGRFLAGIAVGVESLALPLYVRELAPPHVRGSFVALNELAIAAGMLAAFVSDYLLTESRSWRWMLGIAAVPGAVQWLACAGLPESPRWLLSTGHPPSAAEDVLLDVRAPGCWLLRRKAPGPEVVAFVKAEVRATLAECRANSSEAEQTGLGALFKEGMRAKLAVGLGLCLFQQLTGQPTIIYYASNIFRMAGFQGAAAANAASISLGIAKMLATSVTLIVIERVGRKILLIAGQIGMCLGTLLLTLVFAVEPSASFGTGPLAVVALVIFVGSFSVGYGPVTWVVLTELFPTVLRGRAMSVGIAVNWFANAVVSLTFLSVIKAVGEPAAFAGYTVIGLVALFFCWQFVPETRGSLD